MKFLYGWGLFRLFKTLNSNLDNRIPESCAESMSLKQAPMTGAGLPMAESVVKLTKRCAKTCRHEDVWDAGCNFQTGRVPDLPVRPVPVPGKRQSLLCFTNDAGNAEGFVLPQGSLRKGTILSI